MLLVPPVSKLLLKEILPTLMASLLYLGAGLGMYIIDFIKHKKYKEKKEAETKPQASEANLKFC